MDDEVCGFPLQRTAVVVSLTLSVTMDCNGDKFPQHESPHLSNKHLQHLSTLHLYAQCVTNAYINKARGGATVGDIIILMCYFVYFSQILFGLCAGSVTDQHLLELLDMQCQFGIPPICCPAMHAGMYLKLSMFRLGQ